MHATKLQLPTLLANLHQIQNIWFYPIMPLVQYNVDKNRHVINFHSTPHESQAAQNVEIKIDAKYEEKNSNVNFIQKKSNNQFHLIL